MKGHKSSVGNSRNHFRRNPVTGHWSVIVDDQHEIDDLIANEVARITKKTGRGVRCLFCAGSESRTPPELFAIRHSSDTQQDPVWSVRVIPEKQPLLQIFGDLNSRGLGMYDVLDGVGAHELVIETPDHGVHLRDLEVSHFVNILTAYRERIIDLKRDTRFRYILVHKNYGEGHKDLLHHSHSHIIATPITPTRVKLELMNAMEHYQYKERCVFCDIISQELAEDERIILENDKFIALSPFAARAPFEVWILPRQHETFFESNEALSHLAAILKDTLQRMHLLLDDPNFVMVLHSGPNLVTGRSRGYWTTVEKDYHWHIEITPKFRGYSSFEFGSGFYVNVVSPEKATELLKQVNPDQNSKPKET